MTYISTRPYPYLPEGRNFLYVLADNEFMKEAARAREELSTTPKYATGAVVVKDGKIIGRGANQAAVKSKWIQDFHTKHFCVRRFFGIPTGQKYWLCPGCAKPKDHAEPRAIRDAQKNNSDVSGADLYLYGHWWCCKDCWDAMTKAGIKNVYLVEGASEMFK